FLSSSDWVMLLQVPTGNAFQYQYQIALNGDGAGNSDTVEIWANQAASDLSFNPLFTDAPENRIFSQVFDAPSSNNTTPIARAAPSPGGRRLHLPAHAALARPRRRRAGGPPQDGGKRQPGGRAATLFRAAAPPPADPPQQGLAQLPVLAADDAGRADDRVPG